jgi:hypothetical protein
VADALPTEVDVRQLTQAITWLQQTKDFIDQSIVTELKKVKDIIGNAAVNAEDPNKMDYQLGSPSAAMSAGANVPGGITDPGATHFGLFPAGRELAGKHAGAYNNVLAGLDHASKELAKAIAATRYIIDNYSNTEDANAADIARIMQDPPYQPGSNPATTSNGGY